MKTYLWILYSIWGNRLPLILHTGPLKQYSTDLTFKDENWCSRASNIFFLYSFHSFSCQNLLKTIPIMQINYQQYGRRFGCVVLLAVTVASSHSPQAEIIKKKQAAEFWWALSLTPQPQIYFIFKLVVLSVPVFGILCTFLSSEAPWWPRAWGEGTDHEAWRISIRTVPALSSFYCQLFHKALKCSQKIRFKKK